MPKLGLENGQLQACPSSPNCVCSQDTGADHYIDPILVSSSLPTAKTKLLSILEESARAKVTVQDGNYIRAEFSSRIFRFVDDVEFLLQEKATDETVIEVRSASRVGYSDFGVNRKRIEKIRDQFAD